MAKHEPSKSDEINSSGHVEETDEKSSSNQSLQDQDKAPSPETSTKKARISVPDTVLGESDKTIPNPSDVVVPFEKIEEIMTECKTATRKTEKNAAQNDAPDPEKTQQKKAARRGRPPKADKEPTPEKPSKDEKKRPAFQDRRRKIGSRQNGSPGSTPSQEPKEVPRSNELERIVYLLLSKLHAFKNHPFQVRDDADMKAMVESVKAGGVNQPAIVRPRVDGGYEIISGHRRQKASELAGFADMPCIVRHLSDDEAVLKMAEDNINQRKEMLPSERSKMLKMQLEAIKHQGVREPSGQLDPKDVGKRSNETVAERNNMTVKQVQRYIRLDNLVPELMKMADEKKIAFTPAVELSYIKPKNQQYIVIAIEAQQSSPSLSQAQRMRDLDQKRLARSCDGKGQH